MRTFFDGLVLSISFFTQLPITYKVKNITDKTYKYLALSIPLNGAILALFTILIYLASAKYSNPLYGAFISSILYLFMYGFLHIEALMDITDAYYAKHSGKDAYEVLKDSHTGSLGVLFGVYATLIKTASILYLLNQSNFMAITATFILSRAMATLCIYKCNFHKNSKFIYLMKNALTKNSMIILSILILIITVSLNNFILLPIALIITLFLKKWLLKNIGFINGDGLGFIIEINEIILLNVVIFI